MFKAIDKWLWGYIQSLCRRPPATAVPRHIFFMIADHFEPFRRMDDRSAARQQVNRWGQDYGACVKEFHDSAGHAPRHTFFYPAEDYDEGVLDELTGLTASGYGEVEIHLHHRNDTPAGFEKTMNGFKDLLHSRHGLLGTHSKGHIAYGFVHGNWALCNSRPDGDWCGINEELSLLKKTGCYADFTFPSVPSPTQPRMVNSIYYAQDRPGFPRGHDRGRRAGHGGGEAEGELLLVQGPLALNWKRRKWLMLPRIENGEITGANPPDRQRIGLWLDSRIHVNGCPEWIFIKCHTHGFELENQRTLLGDNMRAMHHLFTTAFNDGNHWVFHYVTAREMYNMICAAVDGHRGDPELYRDYVIKPPPCAR